MNLLFFFLNVLTIAFKLLLLISEFLGVRMFRLVEQTCHRFKRRGKEWFLFGQLIGSWSAPFDGPKWHLCWRQKRLIDPCLDIVTLSATVVKCIFYETLYRVESLESAHFSLISNKEGVFLLTFLFENFIFTECTNCFYWTFFNVAFGDHSFQKWKWEKENEWEKNIFCHIYVLH